MMTSPLDRYSAPKEDILPLGEPDASNLSQQPFMRILRAAQLVENGPPTCWVAGGAVRDWTRGKTPSDIDLFVVVDDPRALFAVRERLELMSLRARCLLSTRDIMRLETSLGRIDIVATTHETAAGVIRRFDFSACAAAVDAWGRITRHRDFARDAVGGVLRVIALPKPRASLWRAIDFRRRGWRMDAGEYRALVERALADDTSWDSYELEAGKAPTWARAIVSALGRDRFLISAAVRRAALDPDWAAELEATALLCVGQDPSPPSIRPDQLEEVGDAERRRYAPLRDVVLWALAEDRRAITWSVV